ncbi:hypothetical protein D7U89_06845 [Stenotrophomonas maltophilia]|uniref:LPD3 domain-containing protein n=1 Tax=Stenotrophomonas maltophilia TaxID=40324 RepID=UPI0015DF41AD|nr:hypothetical protein [Stenotrophomonas maltophilia]MBA0225207.1 hypothetical protein [Stenotrophomonas maltophilia]MBA0365327.1 hypothetical protein [Stenotrophomonas maltophilia]
MKDWDTVWDEVEVERKTALRAAYTGTSQKPEEAARANQLSDQLGQPFGVVAANLADYEQDARRQEIDDAGRASPHVGDFLSDPRRMALASDEAPKLATYANSLVTGEARATAEPNILEQVIGGIVSGWQRGKANALSLLPDGPAVMDPATGRLTNDRSAEEAALRADQERRAQAADVTSASTDRGFQAFDRANKAGSFGGAVRELAGGGTDTLGAIAVTLGQSIGMGAPGLALTAATGGGSRVVTAASAGTGSGLTEFGASIADAMQDAKVDPTDAYAVGQFLRDPQKMAAARDKAAKRGVAIGVFDALTAGVAGHFINNARRSASSAILRTGAEAGVQLGGGAAGEATAQLLTEERLKWGDIIMEGLAEVPTGAVEVHANYRAARASGQVRWINERLDQVMQSGQSNDRLRAATQLAGELKLGERSPEDMKALTAQVAGEDARVYLDADQAQTLFQSAPQVLQDMVGGESALAEQLATGQVVIPMAEWMAAVPRLPNRDEILRNARTTADGLSPAELETLDIDAMARELGVPLDAPAPDATAANARAQVQRSVMAQLVGTKRYTPAQAESQAQLWGAMFGRLGEVTGQDPVALYERYAAGIEAAEAPAEGGENQPRTLMQRGLDALRSLFGRPQVATDGRGQQTIERDGSAYVQRAGQWLLADEQGQARDFLTLDQARTEAERTGGEIVQDDPIDGQRQTWSVALPDTAAREVLAGDILFQPTRTDEVPTGLAPDTPVPVIELEPTTGNPAEWFAESNELMRMQQDGTEVTAPDGQPVRFASRGRKKVMSKGRRDPLRQAVARELPALVESAPIHATSVDTDDKTVSYAYAASAVQYDGQVYPVRLVYRVGNDGVRRAYDFEGFEIGNPDGLGSEALRQSGSDVGAMERAGTAESELRTRGLPTSGLTLSEVLPAFNARPLFQSSEAAPRGQIQIGQGRSMQISLFRGADLSTFLHESGHFFLEVYRDLATADDAAPQLRSDLDALLKWFGVESADQIGVDQHEQFARGFEAYLGEGRAPTPELQSVFSQFKQWILGVYRSLRNLDVELTDEVRGVFDRMLASQEEIDAAQARVGFEPIARDLAEAQALGMTERQFADYQAQVAAAREQAEADLMAQLQEADARARERWWKDELANIRSEVEAEVEATPIVRAYRVLTGRKEAAGEPVPEQLQGLKLDRAVLAATYGDGLLDKMGRVYARKGGTHPEEVAAMLGFTSADELVQGLWTVRQTLAGVNAEADARMQARHGDPMTDGTLPQRALDAVHGSRKIQLLERELGVLADLAKEPRPNRRELKAVAQALLAEKTARQIRPNEYLVAERKAARAAAQAAAKGKFADALQAKRQQALNAVLFAESRAVQQEVESKVGYIRRQMTPQARERLGKAGADYLEAMDTIADTYEFRDVSGRAVARRQSLRQWVEARQADDDLTAVSDALLARVEAESVTNYADLPITEFRELHDAVTNIARLAKLKNKLLSNKDQRDWESAQAELAGAIRGAIAEGKPLPLSDADLTAMQKVGATYTGLMDWVLRPETVVEWLDGGETGPWHDFLWNQAEAAQQQRIELRNRVGGMLEQTMKALTPAQRSDLNRLVYVPSLGRSLSKNTIVAVALNMGNAGNRDKLMRGGFIGKNAEVVQFTPQNIAEMLGHLTPADAQMVQGIWDAVNSLWPDIVEQQRRLSGVAPEQVEPMPLIFTAADGSTVSLRGGYYPAVYDPRAGAGGVKQARAAEEQIMGGTFSRAMTSKGHTKERTEYAAPMLLDYHRVLSRHLNDVITDVSHRGYVKQALRVLEDQELKNLIQQRLSEGAYHALYGSVKNAVRGASVSEPGSSMMEKIGDAAMTNTAVAALGFRIPLVIANTLVAPIQAAARVDPKYLATGYTAYYRNPVKMTEMIHSLSPFMAERANSLDSSYQVVLGKLSGKRGIRAAAMKMAMEVHRWTVPLAERAIWLGRYQQAQAQGVSIDEAVRLADKSIRTTQQAGAPKDLSAAERDPRYKWVRMFIGPMIIMNNRLQESGLRGLYLGRVQSPARALGTWLSAGVLSNAVFELLMGRGPGDEDDDGDVDAADWAMWLARKTLLFPFQTFPLLRDVAGAIDATLDGKAVMSRPNPFVDSGVALARFGFTALKEGRDWIADDDEPDAEKLIKTGVRAAGPLTGIPSNQMLTTGEYLYDVGTGQYTPDNPAEAAAYLMYRRPKDEQ